MVSRPRLIGMNKKKLEFVKGYEVYEVPPLSHYYEEIYPNLHGLRKLSLRGDKNYVWYSVNELGTAYYEKHEMELSAKSAYRYFQKVGNRTKFLKQVDKVLEKARDWDEKIEELDLGALSNKEIAKLLLQTQELEALIFTYYIVSQPYRMKLLEDGIRVELSRLVAGSRIDHYLSLLTESVKTTKVSQEEKDWLALLIKHRTSYGRFGKDIETDNPSLWRDLQNHFEQYKTLSLGDGNWDYDIEYFVKRLWNDIPKELSELNAKYSEIIERPKRIPANQKELRESLGLSSDAERIAQFLADIGHARFTIRTDGFIPNIKAKIAVNIELAKRLGYDTVEPIIEYMTADEIKGLVSGWKVVPQSELMRRKGEKSEYILSIANGHMDLTFGNEAEKLFRELIPVVNHKDTVELKGTTAVAGNLKNRVTVFNWGDDMQRSLESIKEFPILVAGQTRPAMMPLIRLAKGIITDEGGITSHAAIVSRELGIPSVIGTIHATKTFKDGDWVELDANNGVVRKVI